MLFFLISCFSLLLIFQSLLNPSSTSKVESARWKLRSFLMSIINFCQLPILTLPVSSVEIENDNLGGMSLLDLPDLPLDCILEKLTPSGLYNMAGVCSSLRERCVNDYFWEKHLKQKWGKFIGDAAHREWQCYISSKRVPNQFLRKRRRRFDIFFMNNNNSSNMKRCGGLRCPLPFNSVMAWYLAFETGKFWFPAQVLNRENGHVGFMLSCYDAKLSYDSIADNFVARFSAQGRRIIEDGIEWSKIRASDVTTTPEALHVSDCLDDLKPGDHIEIQWRKNKDFPYGWWYGVVAHPESCNGNEFTCQCHMADTVTLEFNQYATGSCWRKVVIDRKDHSEIGNEMDGFYGGIRKLYKDEDIAKWKQLWPKSTLNN